ncbi:MAG: hypothetical protein A2Z21_03790 [Candidatus Fraserbacteria bacterium RBG_16_55_9]|uniref:Addiction module toxin, HicA family n=1 Tax=Fraserbacteria sp. (strain RBG_16_55_9) TaxID=1817864 RepID=A0A1F5UNL0_FRAXR|nr:MAG: hypothetical protein A2Z21_03790 [Candidatus Fraserbacteria bacterium RBG_16_55_9]
MTYRELTQKLRKRGCEFVRRAPGSHEIWWNPANQRFTTIVRHGRKDLPKGTLRAILRDLGISPEELRRS